MKFADIPGHDDVKRRLIAMADAGRMPHALLLEGPTGSAKFALARAFAQYIHCQNRHNGVDSCGKCPSCVQHQTFNHADTIYSFPIVKRDGGSGVSEDFLPEFRELMEERPFMDFEEWLIKLDNINAQPLIYVSEANELLRKLSFTTTTSNYKIVLMWLPERLKEDAANKLLKMVEEPFEDTIFLLASDYSRLILPTIYSRTQRICVKRYDDAEIAAYLQHTYNIDEGDSLQIARLAQGNMSQAINLISVSKERSEYLNLFTDLMRKAYTRQVGLLRKWSEIVTALGREKEMKFYDYCSHMLRENFILNIHTPELNCLTADELQFSSKFSPFINERNVLKLFKIFNDAKADIAANANGKIVNFDLAIKTILLLKA